MEEKIDFFATTAKGMESLLAAELTGMGADNVKVLRAGVSFSGDIKTAYRACLWSRIANRVLFPIKTFSAPSPEKLYGGVKSIRWSDHLSAKSTLAVHFSSSQSIISHTHFGALKTKDAIVDQLRSKQGERPSIDPVKPDLRVNVYLLKDEATVSIDLSGNSLHMRGYREEGSFAPLKENLAAAILTTAGWGKNKDAFIDPMCGSGTLPIEAAMMAANIAPGLGRKYYGFFGWLKHNAAVWNQLIEEAKSLVITDKKLLPKIIGYDRDARAIRIALSNLERAGLRGLVHFEKKELSQCTAIHPTGTIVLNPPYGERLGETEALKPLYQEIGDIFKQNFKGWSGWIFTGNSELAKVIGLKAKRRHVFYNGAIECRLLEYELY
jgi:23S rRNA (guanine2445-N2)-methyltransferase / 23S rRNA (guanine2069-N7)-methyltransferase